MFGKSLYIVGALAGALVFSAAAQAASVQTTGNVHLIAGHARHYYEPWWLYNHLDDESKPDVVDHDGQGMHDGHSTGDTGGHAGDHDVGGGGGRGGHR